MICRNCGTEIEEDSSYCKYCGTKLIRQEEKNTFFTDSKKTIEDKLRQFGNETLTEVLDGTKNALSEALIKKSKKTTNTVLKKLHLKKETPLDFMKKRFKKRKK